MELTPLVSLRRDKVGECASPGVLEQKEDAMVGCLIVME